VIRISRREVFEISDGACFVRVSWDGVGSGMFGNGIFARLWVFDSLAEIPLSFMVRGFCA